MWVYYQCTGILLHNLLFQAKGYAGKDEHKNMPSDQAIKSKGPIPRGIYVVGRPFNSDVHGPFCLPLTPSSYNEMFSRNGFLIHGDSVDKPGEASEGCIVLDRITREVISNSNEPLLAVV
jgi:hypothetical protein